MSTQLDPTLRLFRRTGLVIFIPAGVVLLLVEVVLPYFWNTSLENTILTSIAEVMFVVGLVLLGLGFFKILLRAKLGMFRR